MSRILGLDIGGANLKAAHGLGRACLVPFQLWKSPAQLSQRLRDLLSTMLPFDALAVTMTGELCDCFAGRTEGVYFILEAVEAAAKGKPIQVWTTAGRFVDVPTARNMPLAVASANWLALAAFACRFTHGRPAVMLDIGSTTTDIVPLWEGRPQPCGLTDQERLQSGELVYTGVRRTPLCALLPPPVAAEWFATTLDAYLILGQIAEDPWNSDTADGRLATCHFARRRLARMVGADADMIPPEEIHRLAQSVCQVQTATIQRAFHGVMPRLPGPAAKVIIAGSGEFLARQILSDPALPPSAVISLGQELGPEVSQAACAFAVAILLAEMQP